MQGAGRGGADLRFDEFDLGARLGFLGAARKVEPRAGLDEDQVRSRGREAESVVRFGADRNHGVGVIGGEPFAESDLERRVAQRRGDRRRDGAPRHDAEVGGAAESRRLFALLLHVAVVGRGGVVALGHEGRVVVAELRPLAVVDLRGAQVVGVRPRDAQREVVAVGDDGGGQLHRGAGLGIDRRYGRYVEPQGAAAALPGGFCGPGVAGREGQGAGRCDEQMKDVFHIGAFYFISLPSDILMLSMNR